MSTHRPLQASRSRAFHHDPAHDNVTEPFSGFCEVVVIRDTNNNPMASFNGNTVRASGLERNDSAIISGMRVHHNFIRPQQGMNDDTPADRAGLRVI